MWVSPRFNIIDKFIHKPCISPDECYIKDDGKISFQKQPASKLPFFYKILLDFNCRENKDIWNCSKVNHLFEKPENSP